MSWQAFGDWGSSRLRLYRMQDGKAAARVEAPGIGVVGCEPRRVLQDALGKLTGAGDAPASISLCGMAGARGGLAEADYIPCPAGPREWASARVELDLDGRPLFIGGGLACEDTDAIPEVMRGEETQVFGALALDGGEKPDQLFCLPGTHSKWVETNRGRITGFRTFVTGELFALMQASQLLLPGDDEAREKDDSGFAEGLEAAHRGLSAALFSTRTMQLRQNRARGWARDYLSGLLIGDEIATIQPSPGRASGVTIIGEAALANRYAAALRYHGISANLLDAEQCVLKGLELLHAHA